jgi:hypothetical protein
MIYSAFRVSEIARTCIKMYKNYANGERMGNKTLMVKIVNVSQAVSYRLYFDYVVTTVVNLN